MLVLSSLEKNYILLLVGNIFLLVHPLRQVLGFMQLSFGIIFLGKSFPAHILHYDFALFCVIQCSMESLDVI